MRRDPLYSSQIVKSNVLRGGGSPYKLRQIRKEQPTIAEENSPVKGGLISYAQATASAARRLEFEGANWTCNCLMLLVFEMWPRYCFHV